MTDNRLFLGLNIPVNRIYTFLKWIVIINILFLAGTWLHAEKVIFPNSPRAQWLLVEFNFAKENVLAAWYSSMLFFMTGIVAALCFWADMQRATDNKTRLLNYGWLVMCGIFVMLSFDEMGSFHEMISETPLFKKAGGGHGKLVFFILVGAVAIFMATFFFSKFKTNKLALLLTIFGLLLFLSNPFQEKFEISSWRHSADPDNWHRPVFYLLLEEGSEIFASFCFLFSFVTYAINAAQGSSVDGKALQLESGVSKYFILWLIGLAGLLGAVMLLIHLNAWNIPGDDNGVPQDWPPAATAFVAFIAACYLFFKKNIDHNRAVYALLAVVSLFTSAYFGSYMYAFFEGPFVKMPYTLLAITLIGGVAALIKLKDPSSRLFLAGWVISISISVLGRKFYPEVLASFSSAAFGYLGCASLILALFMHYKSVYRR